MINALDGLFANNGIRRNAELQSLIAQYRALSVTTAIRPAVNDQRKLYGAAKSEWDLLISAVRPLTDIFPSPRMSVNGFGSGATTFDVGSNVANIVSLPLPGNTLTDVIDQWTAITLFNNNLRKFCQYFVLTKGQLEQINSVLGPAENAKDSSATAAFKNTDAQTTGGITELTLDIAAFASDLSDAGYAINTAELKLLGDPIPLVRSLFSRAGGIPLGVAQAFEAEDITPDEVVVIAGTGPVPNQIVGKVFRSLARVTGVELRQALAILKNNTANVANLQDLLNPKLLFSRSWETFTIRTANGLIPLYISGNLNPVLPDFKMPRYAQLLNNDDAIIFFAASVGLRQLSGITGADVLDVAKALLSVETNTGLSDVVGLAEPAASITEIQSAMGQEGTGPKGMYLLRDAFGTISGIPFVEKMSEMLGLIAQINYSSLLTPFQNLVWPTATFTGPSDPDNPNKWVIVLSPPDNSDPLNPIPGDYIVGDTEADVYSNSAYIALILPELQIARIAAQNVRATFDSLISDADLLYSDCTAQLRREQAIRDSIEDDGGFYIAQLPAQKSALIGFVASLHEFGTDESPGGANEVMERIVDTTLAGQAIEGSLREGRNIKALREAGISTDSFLPLVDLG